MNYALLRAPLYPVDDYLHLVERPSERKQRLYAFFKRAPGRIAVRLRDERVVKSTGATRKRSPPRLMLGKRS